MTGKNWKRAADGGVIVAGKKFATLLDLVLKFGTVLLTKQTPVKKLLPKNILCKKKTGKLFHERRVKPPRDKNI